MQRFSKKTANFSVFAPYFDSCGQQRLSELYFATAKHVLQGKQIHTVADIGCGTGIVSYGFAQDGHQVYAVDESEGMLQEAQKRSHPNITYIHGKLPELHLPEVDVALCLGDTLNYVAPEELDKAIANLCSFVRVGGFVVLDYTRAESYEQLDAFQHGEALLTDMDEKTISMQCGYSLRHKTATITISILPDNVHEVHHQHAHADVSYSKYLRKHGCKVKKRILYNPFDAEDTRGFKAFLLAEKITV